MKAWLVAVALVGCSREGPQGGASLPAVDTGQPAGDVAVAEVTAVGPPVLAVLPSALDFSPIHAGTVSRLLTLANDGESELEVTGVDVFGHTAVRVYVPDTLPLRLAPGASAVLTVELTLEGPSPGSAEVVITSNDPLRPYGVHVPVSAQLGDACLDVTPKKIVIGSKEEPSSIPLHVISCGAGPLTVTSLGLLDGSSPSFSLEGPDAPLVLPPGDVATFDLVYVEDQLPVLDEGVIEIASDAFDTKVFVSVTGIAAPESCPTAVITIDEAATVAPLTALHLHGTATVAQHKWSVVQPEGSVSTFLPSAVFSDPIFDVNVVGEYHFQLDVWDEDGVKSCVPAEAVVVVVPAAAIHVELTWHTPNDPDASDTGPEAGSDLDLHFVHDVYAGSGPDIDQDGKPDPWFDQPFDCFWFNAHPNWGSFDPAAGDDPALSRADTDGGGPEVLEFPNPAAGTYRIGVHVWSDHEYGSSTARLRVFVGGALAWEMSADLDNHGLWNAATLEWPSGVVTPVLKEGEPWITPNYKNAVACFFACF